METSRPCVVFRCEGKRPVFLQSGLLSRAVLVYFCACRSELSGLMHHVESTNSRVWVLVCGRVWVCGVCVCVVLCVPFQPRIFLSHHFSVPLARSENVC